MSYKISDTAKFYNAEGLIQEDGFPLLKFAPGSVWVNEFGVIDPNTGKAREWVNIPLEMGDLSYGLLSGVMTYSTGALKHVERGLHLYATMEELNDELVGLNRGYVGAKYSEEGEYYDFFRKANMIPDLGWRAINVVDGNIVGGKIHTPSTWYEGQTEREKWANNVFNKHTGLDLALSGKPIKLNWYSLDEKKAAIFAKFEAEYKMALEDRIAMLKGVAAKGKVNSTLRAVDKKIENGFEFVNLLQEVQIHDGGVITVNDLLEQKAAVLFWMGETPVPGDPTPVNEGSIVRVLEAIRVRDLEIEIA